jgi:hypothetical protein
MCLFRTYCSAYAGNPYGEQHQVLMKDFYPLDGCIHEGLSYTGFFLQSTQDFLNNNVRSVSASQILELTTRLKVVAGRGKLSLKPMKHLSPYKGNRVVFS